jgi:hypothetical protein
MIMNNNVAPNQWPMQDDNQGGAKNNGDVDLHEDLMVI